MTVTIEQLREMLRAGQRGDDAPEPSVEEMREGMVAFTAALPTHGEVGIEGARLGGVRGQKLTPADSDDTRAILYFHGGGYVLGSSETHQSMVSQLAHLAGCPAWSMDYRLAPEHPFPAAIEDGLAAYRGLIAAGIAPSRIVIGGDSAGGGTALATALMALDEGEPAPAGLMLLSPWVDLTQSGASYGTRAAHDPMVRKAGLDRMAALYLDGADARHRYASPMASDLAGLPPMLIQVGPDEVLYSDSIALAERAGAAQVKVRLEVWPGMFHVFQLFHPLLADARAALAVLADWARQQAR